MRMEAKINIAEILKDKPKGIELYSPIFGKCKFKTIYEHTCKGDTDSIGVKVNNSEVCFDEAGKCIFNGMLSHDDREPLLFPSKEMRDWSKFSWKKGDVLVSNDGGTEVIFDKWYDDTYTNFYGKHYLNSENENNIVYNEAFVCTIERYSLEDKDTAKTYINTIEERLGGKLNRETLEVEKAQSEFKDGDILACISSKGCIYILIFRCFRANLVSYYINKDTYDNLFFANEFIQSNEYNIRYATEEEKQQLFDALAKEGKAWDAEKKEFVDLKPKGELKPFDKVLVRNCYTQRWRVNFFSSITKEGCYICASGSWNECIPYNEETAKLIGTTNNWEG